MNQEVAMKYDGLKDQEVLARLETCARKERDLQADVLKLLREVERRRLYADLLRGALVKPARLDLAGCACVRQLSKNPHSLRRGCSGFLKAAFLVSLRDLFADLFADLALPTHPLVTFDFLRHFSKLHGILKRSRGMA